MDALAGLGFEPEVRAGVVRLRNCPFHALASRHAELVCDLNLRFVGGLLGGLLDGSEVAAEARPAPRPPACCVEVSMPPPE